MISIQGKPTIIEKSFSAFSEEKAGITFVQILRERKQEVITVPVVCSKCGTANSIEVEGKVR